MVEDVLALPYAKQGLIGEVYDSTRVLSEDYDETGRVLKVSPLPGAITRLRSSLTAHWTIQPLNHRGRERQVPTGTRGSRIALAWRLGSDEADGAATKICIATANEYSTGQCRRTKIQW
jgi:hypothetical protein